MTGRRRATGRPRPAVFRTAVFALALVAGACGGARPAWRALDRAHDGDRVRAVGRVRLVGSTPAPWVMLDPDSGGAVRVVGPTVEPVLRRLGDLRVVVEGRLRVDAHGARRIEAVAWRPGALADGSVPRPGVVDRVGGTLVLRADDGAVLRLAGPLAGALAEFAGAWVWVAGSVHGADGATLRVRAYGVIAETPPPSRGVSMPRQPRRRARRR